MLHGRTLQHSKSPLLPSYYALEFFQMKYDLSPGTKCPCHDVLLSKIDSAKPNFND